MTKHITLCADDYGQSAPISQAIIELVRAQRLTAVSCLITSQDSAVQAQLLKPYLGKIDIGLHFNLTEGQPLSSAYKKYYGHTFLSLPKMMLLAYSKRINLDVVTAECQAQIERFKAIYGCAPCFVDGHQHVHQFYGIHHSITQLYPTHLPASTYLRLVNPVFYKANPRVFIKQLLIYLLGTKTFKQRLQNLHIPHNTSFAGMYHFAGDYRCWFQYFLSKVGPQGLIMCHPSCDGVAENDKIARARYQEYAYLMSDDFLIDVAAAGVNFARMA